MRVRVLTFILRHRRWIVWGGLTVLPVGSYLYVYDLDTPEGRVGMREPKVIGLSILAYLVMVGISILVCLVLDLLFKKKPVPRGFDVIVEPPAKPIETGLRYDERLN
jgi:hypothetical protein